MERNVAKTLFGISFGINPVYLYPTAFNRLDAFSLNKTRKQSQQAKPATCQLFLGKKHTMQQSKGVIAQYNTRHFTNINCTSFKRTGFVFQLIVKAFILTLQYIW